MSKEIFKANPELDLYYKTSDGEAFFTPNAAENYAKSLKNKSVETVYKTDIDLSDEADSLIKSVRELLVKGAEIVGSTQTVVNTDPFAPETFPNRVLTTNAVAPEKPVAPAEPVMSVVLTEPVAPAEPVVPVAPTEPVAPAETKAVEAKTPKK